MQSDEIREKIRLTNIEKYGTENPVQSSIVQNKIQNTSIKKYGVVNHVQKHIPKESLEILFSKDKLIELHYNQKKTLTEIGQLLGVHQTTISEYMSNYGVEVKNYYRSIAEKEIEEILTPYFSDIKCNCRSLISRRN